MNIETNYILSSQIQLPVLPAGLQIMADQGFRNRNPIIVLPRFSQPAIHPDIRRYLTSQ